MNNDTNNTKTSRAALTFQVWAFNAFNNAMNTTDPTTRRRLLWDAMEHAERAGRRLRRLELCTATVDALWLKAEAAALETLETK